MILTATKTVLNSVPQSINMEDSDINFANTVHNLGVCLDPTLTFQQQISSVCRSCYLELHQISAIRHYLSEDVTNFCVCVFVLSRLDYCNSLLAGCPKLVSIFFLNSKKYRTMLQDSFSEQPDLPMSLLCFILFTGYLLSRGSNTNCLCFASTVQDHFSSGSHLPFKTFSPLHSLPTALLFYRHPGVQNTILPNKVMWSALFLLTGSSYLEPTPCFCLPFYLCQLF